MLVKLTAEPEVEILGCPRCDTALQPLGAWPAGGPAEAICPLCSWVQPMTVVEVGEAFAFNPQQQREDVAASPVFLVAAVTCEEGLTLVDAPDLLEDPAFYALQDGVAPVAAFGWVGGSGILGEEGYRLFLIVRVRDLPEGESDLFRLEFPPPVLPGLAVLNEETSMVLVSLRKGVFLAEAGDAYLQAVQEAGGRPGEAVPVNTWGALADDL